MAKEPLGWIAPKAQAWNNVTDVKEGNLLGLSVLFCVLFDSSGLLLCGIYRVPDRGV